MGKVTIQVRQLKISYFIPDSNGMFGNGIFIEIGFVWYGFSYCNSKISKVKKSTGKFTTLVFASTLKKI